MKFKVKIDLPFIEKNQEIEIKVKDEDDKVVGKVIDIKDNIFTLDINDKNIVDKIKNPQKISCGCKDNSGDFNITITDNNLYESIYKWFLQVVNFPFSCSNNDKKIIKDFFKKLGFKKIEVLNNAKVDAVLNNKMYRGMSVVQIMKDGSLNLKMTYENVEDIK